MTADIRSFLDQRPVQALQGTAGYGLSKTLARRWPVFAAAAAFLLTVAAFTAKIVIETRRAQAAERAALEERDRAWQAEQKPCGERVRPLIGQPPEIRMRW